MSLGLNIFKFFQPKNGRTAVVNVTDIMCSELVEAALEYQIRELSFWTCVNFVANAIGRCEVRTYRNHEEIKEQEYYLWNVEPNTNQNSSAFWHKAIAKLFEDNECLIIPSRKRGGYDAFVVADRWIDGQHYPSKMDEYSQVSVGDYQYDKTFYENNVIHLKLNHADMRPVINGLYQSYYKLLSSAMAAYGWENGHHIKVHVGQLASGSEGWAESFQAMIEAQIKPFVQSNSSVLPEFDGYDYSMFGGSQSGTKRDTRDIRAMIDDILVFTARAVGIADVLIRGDVESTGDAWRRTLTACIDPICDQFTEEAIRKRYGYEAWKNGTYLRMDSSTIQHFDLFGQAANIEKLLGSGWTINDIRRAAGEEIIDEPWANRHFITKNLGEVTALEAQEGGISAT